MSCYSKCPVALPHSAMRGFVNMVFPDDTHSLFVAKIISKQQISPLATNFIRVN